MRLVDAKDIKAFSEAQIELSKDLEEFMKEFVGTPFSVDQYNQPSEKARHQWDSWWRQRGYKNFRLIYNDHNITIEPYQD